jgi:chromosome segregation ATPase
MEDTPLGKIVSIRGETDRKVIKDFSKEQRKIRSDWQRKKAKKIDTSSNSYEEVIEGFKKMFENLSKGGV